MVRIVLFLFLVFIHTFVDAQAYNRTGIISGPAVVGTGKTITLTAATPGGKWGSSSATIATISSDGRVTGIAAGNVTIWYAVPDESGSDNVIARMFLKVSSSQQPAEETTEKIPEKTLPETRENITEQKTQPIEPPEKTSIETPEKAHQETPEKPPEKKPSSAEAFSIAADPGSGELTITTDTGAYTSFSIADKTSRVLIKQHITGPQTKVDISLLLPGSYYLMLEKDGKWKTTMFVKDK